jgi:hypothetical protein
MIMTENVDINFDFEVSQLTSLLETIKRNEQHRDAAAMYGVTLDEEWEAFKALTASLIEDEDGYIILDEEALEEFYELICEIKLYVMGCI